MNDGTSPDGAPLVSICLPSLNTRPFLEERIASILGQTFGDWELVVSDSCSDDGSWELFQALARDVPRCRIDQAPRGLYPSWNHCLRQARGRYVYVATSDDVMALDCIGKMVAALEAHPECDLAHCPLRITDGEGRDLTSAAHPPWPDCTVFAQRPKLSPFKQAMSARIAQLLGIQNDAVSVKAKTGERVGSVGLEEAIDAHAVVLLTRRS